MPERFRRWEVPEIEEDPIGFELAGQVFYAIPQCPFGVLADLQGAGASTAGRVGLSVSQEFIESVLVEGQVDLFRKVTHDTVRPVSKEQVQEIVDWLIECYTARPTEPAAGSSSGPEKTGTSSTETPSDADTTSET